MAHGAAVTLQLEKHSAVREETLSAKTLKGLLKIQWECSVGRNESSLYSFTAWDHFHKTFFLKVEGTHTLFGSSFSAAKLWTFTNSANTFPILKVPQKKSSWRRREKRQSPGHKTNGSQKRRQIQSKDSSFSEDSSTTVWVAILFSMLSKIEVLEREQILTQGRSCRRQEGGRQGRLGQEAQGLPFHYKHAGFRVRC